MARRAGVGLVVLTALLAGTFGASQLPVLASTDRGQERPVARGELLAVYPLRPLPTAEEVRAELTGAGFDTGNVQFGVDTYQLVYRTVGVDGGTTVASGLFALPRNDDRSLSTVSYTHGTELDRADAPSMGRDGWAVAAPVTYASAGFAAVAPDYLGLGLGPGTHPFLHLPSEVTASVDLLRAARTFAGEQDRRLRRDVFVTGFSQGASAATALAGALQDGTDRWFRLGALAPIAGAYAFGEAELPALVDGTVPPPYQNVYLAYLVVSWDRIHDLYADPGEMFRSPYHTQVERLFDGQHGGQEIAESLPASPAELFTGPGLELLDQPSGRFAGALAGHDASCAGFQPATPVRLLVSAADEQVVAGNTEWCQAALREDRVDAPIVDLGDRMLNGSTHLGANVSGTAYAVQWFQELR